MNGGPRVAAVHRSAGHTFSKFTEDAIVLVAGLGVQGDAHAGGTVRHRSHAARDATRPNLRQVHLLHAELFDELIAADFAVWPGDLGENITTRGIDLLALAEGTRLHIGAAAVLEVTGLRSPCSQLDRFQPGLAAALLLRDGQGRILRKAGVMSRVLAPGEVRAGDSIRVFAPDPPLRPLGPV